MRAPDVRGPEERRWAAAAAPARGRERVLPVAVGFYGTVWVVVVERCRRPEAPAWGLGVSRVEPRAQLLPVPACACLCLSVLPVLPVPACPARTSPAYPLGPATLQPLKLALLIAARELIYIYWRLHPLAADPFIFNKEEESCLAWEAGEERRFNRTNPGSSPLS